MEGQTGVSGQTDAKRPSREWLQRGTMTSTKSERRGQADGEGGGWEDVRWQIVPTHSPESLSKCEAFGSLILLTAWNKYVERLWVPQPRV